MNAVRALAISIQSEQTAKQRQSKRVGKLVCTKDGIVIGVVGGQTRFLVVVSRRDILQICQWHIESFIDGEVIEETDFTVTLRYH